MQDLRILQPAPAGIKKLVQINLDELGYGQLFIQQPMF